MWAITKFCPTNKANERRGDLRRLRLKTERTIHAHAPTLAARGELHFNELLILVCCACNNNRLDEYLCPLFEVQRREEEQEEEEERNAVEIL